MSLLDELFAANRKWAAEMVENDPQYFKRLEAIQKPQLLWIGCSDSRVPANQLLRLPPGDVFVHRNIANVVEHTDVNCLSVLQYAVDVLQVKHIIVTGHYGCGGVRAALERQRLGLIDNWLRHIVDVHVKHRERVDAAGGVEAQVDRLCELNVIEQVDNVCQTSIVRDAWERGQDLTVHGWCYGLRDGLIRDLRYNASNVDEAQGFYRSAVEGL